MLLVPLVAEAFYKWIELISKGLEVLAVTLPLSGRLFVDRLRDLVITGSADAMLGRRPRFKIDEFVAPWQF